MIPYISMKLKGNNTIKINIGTDWVYSNLSPSLPLPTSIE